MAASLPRRDVTLAAFQEALLAVVQMEPRGQRLVLRTGRPPPKGSKTWSYALADGRVHDDAARRRPSEIDGSADLAAASGRQRWPEARSVASMLQM